MNKIKTLNNLREEILTKVKEYSSVRFQKETFNPGKDPVPVSGKVIDHEELCNLVEAGLDGWLTTGRFNDQFERKLGSFLNVKHVLSVNSGSSANLVAFNTLTSDKLGDKKIKPGDEVIGVAAGFPTTVNPQIQFGAIPVFVDVNLRTHNVNVDRIEAAITEKTRAIMLAHALGNPFEAEKVKNICEKYNLWLIEDCCDALGATVGDAQVGSFGDIATLSFYPAHHITMGEGGAVFTNNNELATIAESYRDWGRDCYCKPGDDNTCGQRFNHTFKNLPSGYDHKYTYSHPGYNLKITDMQAACGVAQINKLESFIKHRRSNFEYLKQRLGSISDYVHLPESTPNSVPSWFGFALTIKNEKQFSRNMLQRYLDEKKIGTRLLFAGNLTKQPYMENVLWKVSGDLTNTDVIMRNTIWIGVYPGLTEEHLDYVCNELETFFGVGF